jgi:hypothetical protein
VVQAIARPLSRLSVVAEISSENGLDLPPGTLDRVSDPTQQPTMHCEARQRDTGRSPPASEVHSPPCRPAAAALLPSGRADQRICSTFAGQRLVR